MDTQSSEQEESLKGRFYEYAASLQFVVLSTLVTLACLSEFNSLKKVTRVDAVFVFFSGINSLIILVDA